MVATITNSCYSLQHRPLDRWFHLVFVMRYLSGNARGTGSCREVLIDFSVRSAKHCRASP